MGFLLGSCGVGLALTSEICLKGLPKTPTGEIMQFKGQQATVPKVKHMTATNLRSPSLFVDNIVK